MSLDLHITAVNLDLYSLTTTKQKTGKWSLMSLITAPDSVSANNTFVTQISSKVEVVEFILVGKMIVLEQAYVCIILFKTVPLLYYHQKVGLC